MFSGVFPLLPAWTLRLASNPVYASTRVEYWRSIFLELPPPSGLRNILPPYQLEGHRSFEQEGRMLWPAKTLQYSWQTGQMLVKFICKESLTFAHGWSVQGRDTDWVKETCERTPMLYPAPGVTSSERNAAGISDDDFAIYHHKA